MKKLFIIASAILVLTSCKTIHTRYLQGDVIGFADRVETSYNAPRGLFSVLKPQDRRGWDLLDNAQERETMRKQIQTIIPRGENTTAYYAMELATERIKYMRRHMHDPQTKYYIFLITDGLDNASPELAKKEKKILFSKTPEQYKERLQKKLKHTMGWFAKNTFEVYPMMFEGEDMQETKDRNHMSNAQFKQKLEQDMECFRYSSVGEAPKLISADNFKTIIGELKKKFVTSSYTFRVPRSYANKKVRMNFKDARGQKVSLTGTLKKSGFSYVLTDISLDNPQATYSKTSRFCSKDGATFVAHAAPTGKDELNTYFTIEDFRIGTTPYFPQKKSVEQEYESSPGFWQLNSEYHEVAAGIINTYFLLVIDGSTSLDGKNKKQNGFELETKMALDIMDMLTGQFE